MSPVNHIGLYQRGASISYCIDSATKTHRGGAVAPADDWACEAVTGWLDDNGGAWEAVTARVDVAGGGTGAGWLLPTLELTRQDLSKWLPPCPPGTQKPNRVTGESASAGDVLRMVQSQSK